MGKPERVLLVPDLHCDDHDPRAVALAVKFSRAIRPDRIIFLGDVLDSGWASDKFPVNQAEVGGQLQREIDAWHKVLSRFDAPRIDVIPGNHDYRIVRSTYKMPGLYDFRGLKLSKMLCPDGQRYADRGVLRLASGNFTVTHGSIARKWAGQSAAAEMLIWGTNGATGHCHRLCPYYQSDDHQSRMWLECGCLSNNPPRYKEPHRPAAENWMHGMGMVDIDGGHFHAQAIPITRDYRAIFEGRSYRA